MATTKQTELALLLENSRFDDARELLQARLASGQLLDPRTDAIWRLLADQVAAAIEASAGRTGVLAFWERLLDFFVRIIEPVWGHAHKGHIYFRLGLAALPDNLTRGKAELEAALREDVLLETSRGGTPEEIVMRSANYSTYVALAIVERIEDSQFPSAADKERFVRQFFVSFDAAIRGASVKEVLVHQALGAIAPAVALPSCKALYTELHSAAGGGLPFATVSLTGTVLESLLLADLLHRRGVTTTAAGRDIRSVELGVLLNEAIAHSVFPSDSVRVACQLVHIFRNRLHPGNELQQTYKLVPRVATTVKVFFELALLEWRRAFP